jgi:hypothetical protein
MKLRFVAYLLAGTGYFVVLFGLILVLVGLAMVGAVPGLVMEDETVMSIGLAISMLSLYTPGILLLVLVVGPAMNASLMRAIGGSGTTSCRSGSAACSPPGGRTCARSWW